jgi:hypothetical protein
MCGSMTVTLCSKVLLLLLGLGAIFVFQCVCVCACRSIAVCTAYRVELKYQQGGAWAGGGGLGFVPSSFSDFGSFSGFFSNSNQPHRFFSE